MELGGERRNSSRFHILLTNVLEVAEVGLKADAERHGGFGGHTCAVRGNVRLLENLTRTALKNGRAAVVGGNANTNWVSGV